MIVEFLKLDANQAEEILDDIPEIMKEYESRTGKSFYAIAEFLIYGDEEMDASEYVTLYNAITGAELSEEEFNEYNK